MSRYHIRLAALVAALFLSFVLGAPSGVAHAEPGPRPTLTPVPPVQAEPVAAPAAPRAEAPRQEEPAAPTPRPRRMITAVVTPIAPVQPTTMAPEWSGTVPLMVVGTTNVRYVAPGFQNARASITATNVDNGMTGYRALLVSLIALDIMGVCMLLRRRYAAR